MRTNVRGKVDAAVGAPQVAYRETISRTSTVDYTHKKQTGGAGQFARVAIRFEPQEPGAGVLFESAIVGGSVPQEYVPVPLLLGRSGMTNTRAWRDLDLQLRRTGN